ncbi:ABC transporter substrate-binding protein [Chloroflexota bacterium]
MPKIKLAILGVILLLTGCRSDKTLVTFSVFGDPAELAAYQTLVEAFEARHPDIDIELRHIPSQSEYRQRLAADFSGGSPSNVMLLNYRRFATFAAQGGLEPLGPYLAKSSRIKEADFFSPTIEAFYLEGKLWCIPQNLSSLVVYYNRDLFDAAGMAYPTNDWARSDFLEKARALTLDLDGDGNIDQYGAGIAPNLFRLAPFIWQNGGELVDNVEHPTRLALDTPEALAAFQWFVDLQVKEHVVPDAVAESAETSESRFLNGRLAMYFNSRRGGCRHIARLPALPGMWLRCHVAPRPPASCTAMLTAWRQRLKIRSRPGNLLNLPIPLPDKPLSPRRGARFLRYEP